MPAPVIYINGYPGVGTLTIARALQTVIALSAIIDNHSLIDPIEKHCPRGSAFYQERRGKYRRSVLKPIKEDPTKTDTIYIFTDSQTEHNECMSDNADLAIGDHSRRFYSVILDCDYEENVKRLMMAGRGGSFNGKLTDPEKLWEYREKGSGIWKFHDSDELVLNDTEMSPLEVAEKIKAFVDRRQKEGKSCDEWELQ